MGNCTDIVIALFGICGTLAGTIIGWKLSTKSQINLLRKISFSNAAKTFREIFSEEHAFLIKPTIEAELETTENHINRVADAWFKKHETAILNFWFYIPKNRRNEYKKAYQEYCYPNSCFPDTPRLDYNSEVGEKSLVENEKECRKIILERMEKLLEFAIEQ